MRMISLAVISDLIKALLSRNSRVMKSFLILEVSSFRRWMRLVLSCSGMSLDRYGKRALTSAEIPVSNYMHQPPIAKGVMKLYIYTSSNLPAELVFVSVGQLESDDCVPTYEKL